jgi:hypothetical protein
VKTRTKNRGPYSTSKSVIVRLRKAAKKYATSTGPELEALARLEAGEASGADIDLLLPLAEQAGFSFSEWVRAILDNPRKLNPGYAVPPTTVRLGSILDIDLELGGLRKRVDEFKGFHVLAGENGIESGPGRSRLFLVPGKLENLPDEEASPSGARTFETWTGRPPDKMGELETPQAIGYYQGRVLRIGYRSDKWDRSRPVDYDHDFTERGGRPPKLYTDRPSFADSTGAVIAGGDFVITARGIE